MAKQSTGFLSPKTYDTLKWIAQIALPALGTLYFALAALWGLPKADEIVGTILAIDAFLGVLLGLSTAQYNASPASSQGTLDVIQSEHGDRFAFNLRDHPVDIVEEGNKKVVFKVRKIDEAELPPGPEVELDVPPHE